MSGINVGGEAAIMGGVHSDSHDINTTNIDNSTHNTSNSDFNNTYTTNDNSVTNYSSTVYQAQLTDMQLRQNNEADFLRIVQETLADGFLDQAKMAKLNQLSISYQLTPQRANEIIETVRNNTVSTKQGDSYLELQIAQEIFSAVQANAVDVLKRKMPMLDNIAENSQDSNVSYYNNMLKATFNPEVSTMKVISTKVDDYWLLYWSYVAHVKRGNIDAANALLPRLSKFNNPKGDISLLLAVGHIAESNKTKDQWEKSQAEQCLAASVEEGLSEPLSALWYAVQHIIKPEQPVEEWYKFHIEHTLKELKPLGPPSLPPAMPAMPKMQVPEMPQQTKQAAPTPPPMPEFNAQKVVLNQMQGWNALEAAKQMNIGMTGMPSMPAGMPNMPQSPAPAPAMPNMPTGMPGEKSIPVIEAVQMATEVRTPEGEIDQPDPYQPHYGIILTNSIALARKYKCTTQDVYDVFNNFIQTAYDQQMYWYFLDIANDDKLTTWVDINDRISDFIEDENLNCGPDLHLFIVGGHDVIPVPYIDNPYDYGWGSLPTDMCYCYEGSYISDMTEGDEFVLDADDARNNVSRLPLEDGEMSTDIHGDLGAYFNVCSQYGGGIPVGNVVMSSNNEWIPASRTMSEHLPLLYSAEDPELIKNGMYISPKLDVEDDDTMDIFCRSLSKADMLMFNFHGADQRHLPGFYSSCEAFSPRLLNSSNARVINTVACFGARYTGYKREESMLLSSLYGGGVLLYTGSLIPVPMFYDPERNEARELLLNPGTGSEVLMRLFPLYQFKGMTTGKALLQAKCDYFNMCRYIEDDGFSLCTALMFCSYGNPMLHIRKRKHVIDSALENDAMPPAPIKGVKSRLAKTLRQNLVKKESSTGSLLDQIRGYVDNNLAAIRNIVETRLYNQLGLEPRQLESIDMISKPTIDGNYNVGYVFNYHNAEAQFAADTHAETDKEGNIKRIYSTK